MKHIINIIGSVAAVLTTTAFLPQVIKIIKFKETKDISLIMYILFCVGVFLWLVYGVALHAFPMIVANVITLVLALIILIYKIKHG